ncbi:hypothetical protein BO71DRAFT_388403 [Aspergillus ellipticus CBS 707.79]|uniref:Uncharacterized protein n=1 Tax=Aspergillus ellipticus CBS 707.79 TaxID=1448320 RepID=A0A319D6C7_9EURO|nr:hypothetical protein BO71DRAFT_388403 [Aspergillus ellipticus CBS 707.79]
MRQPPRPVIPPPLPSPLSRWCFAPSTEGHVVMTDPGRWSRPGRSPGLFGLDFDRPFSSSQEHL